MADNTIPHVAPGIAGFSSESYAGPDEVRFGEGVATTTEITVADPGAAGADLPVYSVVDIDGALAAQGTPAYGITTAPIVLADGQTTTIAVYRAGNFDLDQLNWDASFATDAQKAAAFEGGASPNLFAQKKHFNSDNIAI